ncbi:MAG TPA: bifunctional UDP-N-acetylglucosamine diphosphorylase/glucosamine-1-phosphate N-acetyltransferase GlmU [Chthonomonadaceae bacterium]|nr:bifunctional UDP-N-acetylglucosamine diphosphorylase/glucosamine-1-phosphate N-acetyltransferase GlmU [Chthonomonadaceae bacterium]
MSDSSAMATGAADNVAAIILAAGKSTRMRSKTPKPLHALCGRPLTGHVIHSCRTAGVARVVVVVGHEADAVRKGLGDSVEYALQEAPLGTGHAALAARSLFHGWSGTILVLAGDVPLLPAPSLQRLLEHHKRTAASATLLTAFLDDPTGYGRVIRDADGCVAAIVEHRDATPEQRAIKEWNPSIYAFESDHLWAALSRVEPANNQKEIYLTDAIGILRGGGRRVEAVPADGPQDVLGVNNRVELAEAGAILQRRILVEHMLAGVSITDPASTYIDAGVTIGQDTTVEPATFLYRGTTVGEDCTIGPFARISGSRIGNRCRIVAAQITDSTIGSDVSIGPFANLRPATTLADRVKIGDFVETKNANFGPGAQASHLSYIGDAEVGGGTNIGAGTITCNYDGYRKHRTVIGRNAFVGSHATLVAPITIGDGAFIAAGSSVTVSVPADAMAIARARTTLKEGWAATYRAERSAAKAAEAANARPNHGSE